MVSAPYAHEKLSVEEAFLIARWIARLPELISGRTKVEMNKFQE